MTRVLVTPEAMRDPDATFCRMLADAGLEFQFPTRPEMARGGLSDDEVVEQLAGIDAVIASGEAYSAGVIERLPQLRVIARAGVGYDRVDVAAATARRIAVTITPNANRDAVAELTLALMFALTKRLLPNDRSTRAGGWDRRPLAPIRGRSLGIVGLGRIGRCLALKAAALGMQVTAYDAQPDPRAAEELGVRLLDLDSLLAESDFVSLHCPLTPETTGLFNRETLAKMKPGSSLINMARGKLVVEADLLQALQSGHLAGAGLDVFEQEPPGGDNPLFALDSVVVSPHMGGVDELSCRLMGEEAAQAIIDLSRGTWPAEAVVNRELEAGWQF